MAENDARNVWISLLNYDIKKEQEGPYTRASDNALQNGSISPSDIHVFPQRLHSLNLTNPFGPKQYTDSDDLIIRSSGPFSLPYNKKSERTSEGICEYRLGGIGATRGDRLPIFLGDLASVNNAVLRYDLLLTQSLWLASRLSGLEQTLKDLQLDERIPGDYLFHLLGR